MKAACTECHATVSNPGMRIIKGSVGENIFSRETSTFICLTHIRGLIDKLHRLEDMPEGEAYEVRERRNLLSRDYLILSKDDVETTLGYLTVQDAREHFPKTIESIVRFRKSFDRRNSAYQN